MDNSEYLKKLGLWTNSDPESFQFKELTSGIYFIGGISYLHKIYSGVKDLLNIKEDLSILTIDPLNDNDLDYDTESIRFNYNLAVITNVDPKFIVERSFVRIINRLIQAEIPIILGSPYKLREFESECSKLLLSNIEPFIRYGIDV